MINLIIDCDPGHDDIIALMVALAHPETFKIIGATTVAGNQTLPKVTNNLLKVLDYLGVELEVSAGYDAPLCRPGEPQPEGHGESGLDGPVLPEAHSQPTGLHAVDYMRYKLLDSEEKVTFLALGPLTNIAMLIRTYPEAAENIERICLMGGSITSGNILPKAEFNIYHDPEAAKIVYASGIPIVMSGLEVCSAGSVLFPEYEPLKGKGRASELTFELLEFFSRYSRTRGSDRCPIFDMTPVIHLMNPELFTSKRYFVDIETEGLLCRGMTVADTREYRKPGGENTEVLLDVNREKFVKIFLDSISKLDEMLS